MERADRIRRRLKLRQLDILHAVVECGSMAKAAEQLAISQPVVSKAIAELEDTLGVRLVDRSPRGVEPTLYGHALLKRSIAIFNDLRTSVEELEFLADPTLGELRIGSSESVAAGMLCTIIDRLSRRHPRLTFEVTLGGGLADLQDRELRAHNLDLIIGRLPRAIPEDMDAEILYREKVFVVAGMRSPLARRRKIELAELINEPWCLPALETFPWSLIADSFRATGLEPPRSIVTARSILLQNGLLATGRFITILPGAMLHFSTKSLLLKILPVSVPIQPWRVGIITLKKRTLSPVAQLFIDCARRVAEPLARTDEPNFQPNASGGLGRVKMGL
jgi:DNA-binding transcriptional LysR family regulator